MVDNCSDDGHGEASGGWNPKMETPRDLVVGASECLIVGWRERAGGRWRITGGDLVAGTGDGCAGRWISGISKAAAARRRLQASKTKGRRNGVRHVSLLLGFAGVDRRSAVAAKTPMKFAVLSGRWSTGSDGCQRVEMIDGEGEVETKASASFKD